MLQDDYHWLREKDSPDVIAHLEAENAYAEALTKPTTAFREALYREMLARIKEDDQTVPYPFGGWLYYSRTETGKQYPIYCRTRAPDAPETVPLDLTALAEGHPFLSLGAYAVSDDGRWLAYSVDFTGARDYTGYVKDLTTGALAPERIEKVSSVAWAADSATLFYVVEDDAKRPYRLWRHRLGAPIATDAFLYEETDALFRLGVWRSRSKALLFAGSGSFTTTELRWLPAAEPTAAWHLILGREHDHEYAVDHGIGAGGDVFYIRTNAGGRRNFRLVTAPLDDPRPERWQELIAHRDDVMLADVDVFAAHYVVHERAEGLIPPRVTDRVTAASRSPSPTSAAAASLASAGTTTDGC